MIWINAGRAANRQIASTTPKTVSCGVMRGSRAVMTTANSPLPQRFTQGGPANGAVSPDILALARLRNKAQSIRLRRRQALPAGGPDMVYIVLSGILTAEHDVLSAAPTMVELLYPGDLIASSLLNGPEVTYTSMSATEVLKISSVSLRQEMAADPALADFVFQRLNLQRTRMQLHISMLASLTSEERVAALLLQAACHLGARTGSAVAFDMPLSRTEIAEYMAINADTLSRIMSRLVREGVLARQSRAQITIRDMAALKAHCPLGDAVLALHSNT